MIQWFDDHELADNKVSKDVLAALSLTEVRQAVSLSGRLFVRHESCLTVTRVLTPARLGVHRDLVVISGVFSRV